MKKAEPPSPIHRNPLKKLLPGFCLFLAGICALAVLKFFYLPYAWIFLVTFIICIRVAITTAKRRPFVARSCMSLAMIALVLGLLEVFLAVRFPPKEKDFRTESSDKEYLVPHEYLGYSYRENIQTNIKKFYRDSLTYSATYTTDMRGLRIAPPERGQRSEKTILFFGGSFTFGEGVNDEETMPYRTGGKFQGKYRISNFARGGYGPHQMLVSLERGLVEELVDVPPKYAIYQSILPHVQRAAGHVDWDRSGLTIRWEKMADLFFKVLFISDVYTRS